MSDFVTIRGTVCGAGYEAQLKPARFHADAPGEGPEWHVSATGLPIFRIAAPQTLVWEAAARTLIELELERRLTR